MKRRFNRFMVDKPVTVVREWPDAETITIPGQCYVMGEGGLGARMTQELRVGEVVWLQLSAGLRVYGAVRNQRGFAYGFEFVLVRDNQRDAIQRLCRHFMNS
jgi:hypothetical protein